MGFKTVVVARGKDKEQLVRKLGAIQYIDRQSQNSYRKTCQARRSQDHSCDGPKRKSNERSIGWSGSQLQANHDWSV